MDSTVTFDEANFKNILKYVAIEAKKENSKGLQTVIKVAFSDLRNLPSLGYEKKLKDNKINSIPLAEYTQKLTRKYLNAYKKRPSKKTGAKSKTHPDPALTLALSTRSGKLSSAQVLDIIQGHKILMTMENLVGDILEEYLAERLEQHGWYCCWGSTIDAVDFCHTSGALLQVKNSDNSENSSSSQVRNGTTIHKWARRVSTKPNTFYWDVLKKQLNISNVSEADFQKFMSDVIKNNPNCLYIDPTSKFF